MAHHARAAHHATEHVQGNLAGRNQDEFGFGLEEDFDFDQLLSSIPSPPPSTAQLALVAAHHYEQSSDDCSHCMQPHAARGLQQPPQLLPTSQQLMEAMGSAGDVNPQQVQRADAQQEWHPLLDLSPAHMQPPPQLPVCHAPFSNPAGSTDVSGLHHVSQPLHIGHVVTTGMPIHASNTAHQRTQDAAFPPRGQRPAAGSNPIMPAPPKNTATAAPGDLWAPAAAAGQVVTRGLGSMGRASSAAAWGTGQFQQWDPGPAVAPPATAAAPSTAQAIPTMRPALGMGPGPILDPAAKSMYPAGAHAAPGSGGLGRLPVYPAGAPAPSAVRTQGAAAEITAAAGPSAAVGGIPVRRKRGRPPVSTVPRSARARQQQAALVGVWQEGVTALRAAQAEHRALCARERMLLKVSSGLRCSRPCSSACLV